MEINLNIDEKQVRSIAREEVSKYVSSIITSEEIHKILNEQLKRYVEDHVKWENGVRNATKEIIKNDAKKQYEENFDTIINDFYKKHKQEIVSKTSSNIAELMFEKLTEREEGDCYYR